MVAAIRSFRGPNRFLSNMFIEPDKTYVEREFQAAKTLDRTAARRILGCTDPLQAKKLGQQVVLRPDWEKVKFDIMKQLVFTKFRDHPELARLLLATGSVPIIEGNTWHDNTWGDCSCSKPACARRGLNWLGLILMDVRTELRS